MDPPENQQLNFGISSRDETGIVKTLLFFMVLDNFFQHGPYIGFSVTSDFGFINESPPDDMRTYFLPKALAMAFPREVLPTPEGHIDIKWVLSPV